MPKVWDDIEVTADDQRSDASDNFSTDKRKRRVIAAAQDVDLILHILSQNGNDLDEALKEDLILYANTIKSGSYDEETERKFWINYSKLTRLAKPIHIDTLRYNEIPAASNDKKYDPIYKHIKTLKRYRTIAIASFLAMISTLAYVSVANSTLDSSRTLKNEQLRLIAGLIQNTTIEAIMEEVERAEPNQLYGASVADVIGADEGAGPEANEGAEVEANEGAEAEANEGAEVEANEGAEAEANEGAMNNFQLLRMAKSDIFATAVNSRKQEINHLIISNNKILDLLQLGFVFRFVHNLGEKINNETRSDESLITNQEIIIRVLSGYFLPLLASVLGVCVFIMRTGAEKIENMSFQTHNTGVYSHRFILGVIGGLAISWFLESEPSGTLNSLTPIALAFLVGYSVEILFNIMDGVLHALGAKK